MTAELRAYARSAALRAGVDPDTFERQIDTESGFNPRAHNAGSDASGISQIVPHWHPGVNVWNPTESLDYAARLMHGYVTLFGSYRKALAAYNWGSGNVGGYTRPDGTVVRPWNGERDTLPEETRRYLDVILGPSWPEPGAAPMPVRFDPNTPPIAQDDKWSCAPTSLRWALTALGRKPGPNYIEDLLVRDGTVSMDRGLLDASGAQLAAWIGRTGPEYYGGDGFYGNNEPSISFDWAAAEGDHAYPVLAGGRRFGSEGHWVVVRGYNSMAGELLLMNPAPGYDGIGQTLTREQFDARGPWSAVRVLHPDLLASPAPIPAPAPPARTRAAILTEVRTLLDELERTTA